MHSYTKMVETNLIVVTKNCCYVKIQWLVSQSTNLTKFSHVQTEISSSTWYVITVHANINRLWRRESPESSSSGVVLVFRIFFMLSVTPHSYCVRHKGGITLRRRSRATWYQKERISNCDHCFTLSCLRLLGSKHRTTGQRVITKLEPVRRIMPSFYGFQLLLADYWFLNWGRCDSVIIEMDYEMVFFFHYSCSSAFR